MLWLAYELHGRPVYTGVCRTNGHDVEDDWMLFAWNDAHLIAQRSDSSLRTPRGWILPVDVAHALLSAADKACGDNCVRCERVITTAWEYCDSCLCPLCDACSKVGCAKCEK